MSFNHVPDSVREYFRRFPVGLRCDYQERLAAPAAKDIRSTQLRLGELPGDLKDLVSALVAVLVVGF